MDCQTFPIGLGLATVVKVELQRNSDLQPKICLVPQ